jgi:hypothetical protein
MSIENRLKRVLVVQVLSQGPFVVDGLWGRRMDQCRIDLEGNDHVVGEAVRLQERARSGVSGDPERIPWFRRVIAGVQQCRIDGADIVSLSAYGRAGMYPGAAD